MRLLLWYTIPILWYEIRILCYELHVYHISNTVLKTKYLIHCSILCHIFKYFASIGKRYMHFFFYIFVYFRHNFIHFYADLNSLEPIPYKELFHRRQTFNITKTCTTTYQVTFPVSFKITVNSFIKGNETCRKIFREEKRATCIKIQEKLKFMKMK